MKKILFLSFLIVLFYSCRKKENTPPADPASSVTGHTATKGTLTPSTGGDYCDLKTYYGYVDYHGTVSVDSSVWARFFNDSNSYSDNVYGGSVALNGNVLSYDSTSNSYVSVSGMPVNIAGNLFWNVSGSGTVTAFTQSYTPSYPKYTGGNLLPDTCYKSAGITVNLSGITGHTGGAAIRIFSSGQTTAYKYISGSSGTCAFTSQEISLFNANQPITIYISIDNNYTATLGGMKRGFSNSLFYKKMAYLKP